MQGVDLSKRGTNSTTKNNYIQILITLKLFEQNSHLYSVI